MKTWMAILAVAGLAVAGARAETIWLKNATRTYDYTKYSTWVYTDLRVEIGVWPVVSGHSAGSVWTDDGWQTVRWNNASWTRNVPNAFGSDDESWASDLLAGGPNGKTIGQAFTPFNVDYALFVKNSSGQTFWDNNRGANYRFYVK